MPTGEEIAWAAGFFEGDGTITAVRSMYTNRKGGRSQRRTPQLAITLGQVNREPLDRFAALFGGKVYGPYGHVNKKASPHYRCTITGRKVEPVARALYPWLSAKRKAQIDQALSHLEVPSAFS